MLEKLMRRLPDATDAALLQDLLADAAAFICAYTGRTDVPEALQSAQVQLAAVFYNRLGMEGEARRVEGSVEHVADAVPEEIRRQLNPFRLVKGVG